MSSSTEWFIAFSTFVRLLSSVNQNMPLQIICTTKCLAALCTFVQFDFTVSQQMCPQGSSLTKRFVAFCTFVKLLTSVNQQMHVKPAGMWKRLDAHGAGVLGGHVEDSPPQLAENNWGNSSAQNKILSSLSLSQIQHSLIWASPSLFNVVSESCL